MFEKSELGRIKKLLPLRGMAENFGLVSKSLRPKLGRRSYFTPEGKVALVFLKMYTGLSCPKLMEQLNGNIHYQIFCDVIIDPASQGQNETDRNPVHLLRYPHCERGANGEKDRAKSPVGSGLGRINAYEVVLCWDCYVLAYENRLKIWPIESDKDIKR